MKKMIVMGCSLLLVGCGNQLSATETVEEVYKAVEEQDEERVNELIDLDEENQYLEIDHQRLETMLEESGGLKNLNFEEFDSGDLEEEYQEEFIEELEEMGYNEESTTTVLETLNEESEEGVRTTNDALLWLLEDSEEGDTVRIISDITVDYIEERMEEE